VAASVSYNTRYSAHNRLYPICSYPSPQISFTENGAEPVSFQLDSGSDHVVFPNQGLF